MPNKLLDVQESDTTGDDSSNVVRLIIIVSFVEIEKKQSPSNLSRWLSPPFRGTGEINHN